MNIHIITTDKRFAILKEGYNKAIKLFNNSEQAFYYAKTTTLKQTINQNKKKNINEDITIVVHNKNASVKFTEVVYSKVTI